MSGFISALKLDTSKPQIVVLKGNARYSVYDGHSDNELDEYLNDFAAGNLRLQLVKTHS